MLTLETRCGSCWRTILFGLSATLLLASSLVSAEQRFAAPGFTLQSLTADAVSLSDYQGKVVLLNFWATWCMPCRQEMPGMERLWKKYQDQGLVSLAVSTDEGSPARVQSFVKKLKLSFPVALDPDSKASDLYQVSGLPVSFLIDQQGRIAAKITGSENWMSEKSIARIENLLAESGK
jgi:cytochrome c biogenesis protein CcmG/thiol:disulfide interchange protein DsbE